MFSVLLPILLIGQGKVMPPGVGEFFLEPIKHHGNEGSKPGVGPSDDTSGDEEGDGKEGGGG